MYRYSRVHFANFTHLLFNLLNPNKRLWEKQTKMKRTIVHSEWPGFLRDYIIFRRKSQNCQLFHTTLKVKQMHTCQCKIIIYSWTINIIATLSANIPFLKNTGLDPLKFTKLLSQHSICGYHRHTRETPFKWRFPAGPMMACLK